MTGKNVFMASITALLIVILIVMAYKLDGRWTGNTPEAVREVIEERLESLNGIEKRLARLEKEVFSLHGAPSAGDLEEMGEQATDTENRIAGIESSVSTLQERLKGLEEDPLNRGYSFLGSENAELRREGVNLLTRVARFDPEARAAIRALLRDPSSRVREQAAQKLRDLKDKESKPDMLAMLADPYSRARRRAVQALGAMEARDAAREIGRTLISDGDDRVREEAAEVLRRMKSTEAEEFFIEALKDRNEAVRGQAIAALGEINASSAAPQLRAIYDQDPGTHRLRLAGALKSLGDEVPFQKEAIRLTELIKSDPDEHIRRQAIRDLASLARDSSQEIFSRALEDPSPLVRREAERALR